MNYGIISLPSHMKYAKRDFSLELIPRELLNIPDGVQSPNKELYEAILAVNAESEEWAILREEAKNLAYCF